MTTRSDTPIAIGAPVAPWAADPETVCSQIFVCQDVKAFKIPPGELSLRNCNMSDSNLVWHGSIRFIEQETYPESLGTPQDGTDGYKPVLPSDRIRLKLELYNERPHGEDPWAEVWYNPKDDLNDDNRPETIEPTDNPLLFKIIAQLPGTGYCGSKYPSDDKTFIQIALGLRFDDKLDAYNFLEVINSYKRSYGSYVEQYQYELSMLELTARSSQLGLDNNDSDDEEFGDFVSQ